ncbi:MAG: hypothetical protein HYZ53_22625 [Planctomycetes bacterium]|nr:hypothetical protein [Planctomycetota bacterium]
MARLPAPPRLSSGTRPSPLVLAAFGALVALVPGPPAHAAPPSGAAEATRPWSGDRFGLEHPSASAGHWGFPLELDEALTATDGARAQDVALVSPPPVDLPPRAPEEERLLAELEGPGDLRALLARYDVDLRLGELSGFPSAGFERDPIQRVLGDLAARIQVQGSLIWMPLDARLRFVGERRRATPWDRQELRHGESPLTRYEAGASWSLLKDLELESRWGAEIDTDNTDFVGTTSVGLKF